MRITYRNTNNKNYWEKRWADIPADLPMENMDVYPAKYAQLAIKNKDGKILEAGCGAGRILRFYHECGYDILGIDFIETAVKKLKKIDGKLKVEVGDIASLRFESNTFDSILAFGLYHNLEHNLDDAIKETYRVLKVGGFICASFRADNVQTRLTDWLADRKVKKSAHQKNVKVFHKRNLTKSEFSQLFEDAGFEISSISPVENMPILYKFRIFRALKHKTFNENIARSEGYHLSWIGQQLQNFLMNFFPNQFCNIYVLIASKSR